MEIKRLKMGNYQSNLTRNTLSIFTDYLNQNITRIINDAKCTAIANNVLTINLGGPNCPSGNNLEFSGLNFEPGQTARADCQLTAQFVNDTNTKIVNQIDNIVKNFIDQDSKNSQGFFALALSAQVQGAETSQQIANRISNFVSNNINTYCGSTAIATNELVINLCAPVVNSRIAPTQNASATAFVNCVSNTIVRSFTEDKVLSDVLNKTQQKAASKQEGITGLLLYLIIAGVVIAVIAIIGFVIYLVISRRSSAGTTNVVLPSSPTLSGKISATASV